MQRPNRFRIRSIQHVPAVPSYVHKLHLQKHPQVLRHRRLLESQPHHNFSDRPFPRRQKLQYLPPPRLGHRIKRIRCGRRPRHAATLHSHMGICQALFLSPIPRRLTDRLHSATIAAHLSVAARGIFAFEVLFAFEVGWPTLRSFCRGRVFCMHFLAAASEPPTSLGFSPDAGNPRRILQQQTECHLSNATA